MHIFSLSALVAFTRLIYLAVTIPLTNSAHLDPGSQFRTDAPDITLEK